MKISASILDKALPDLKKIDELLNEAISKDDHVFVVLDDDPTGTQCVHDINVYTAFDTTTLKEAFQNDRLFFLLTNSRAMSAEETTALHKQICENVAAAANQEKKKYLYISRGDSTLRGHYPLETDILAEGLRKEYGKVDGHILIPFFKEGGRFTIDDVHYVKYGEELIPCAETEFAQDKTFGYHSSDLKEYIEEKSQGLTKKEEVVSIGLDELRAVDIDSVTKKLTACQNGTRLIVNAIDQCDVKVFAIAFYKALSEGKIFSIRSAAALVKALGGISDRELLSHEEMIEEDNPNGGIIVVGSHTAKTTRQLEELLKLDKLEAVEFHSSAILESQEAFFAEVKRCVEKESAIISSGRTPVVYTERKLLSLPDDSRQDALDRSVKISEGVYHLVKDLRIKPSFVLAKGGITSADVATKGLNIRKGYVLGQIMPGIPVWKADENSRFKDIPYIVFPGNVGEDETLKKAVEKLL